MRKTATHHADHILEAIDNIGVDIAGQDLDGFRADRRARQLVERNLEIISEASRRLPQELKDREASVEWTAVAGIGNVLRHDYHRSSPEILWETCRKDLPRLRAAVIRIRRQLLKRGGS